MSREFVFVNPLCDQQKTRYVPNWKVQSSEGDDEPLDHDNGSNFTKMLEMYMNRPLHGTVRIPKDDCYGNEKDRAQASAPRAERSDRAAQR